MSAISDITDTLNKSTRGGDNSLTLKSTTFSNKQAALFFKNALSGKDLTIGKAQIEPNGDASVTVRGPGSMLGFDNLTLALTFRTDPDDKAVVDTLLTGTFDAAKPPIKPPLITWISLSGLILRLDMSSEFGILKTAISGNINIGSNGAVLPIVIERNGASQWSIRAAKDAAPSSKVAVEDLVELVGGEQLTSFIPQPLKDVLQGISVIGIGCQFDTQAKTVSYFSVGVSLDNGWDINEKVGLMPGLSMSLVLLNPVGPTPKTVIGMLRATARVGTQKIPVFLQGTAGASTLWSIGVFPEDKITLPGLSHILELAGGEDFTKTLPEGLTKIPDILLGRFIINFDPSKKTINEISFAIGTAGSWEVIAGYLTIQNITLDMEILDILDPVKRGMQGTMSAAFLIGQTSVQFSLNKPTTADPWTISGWLAAGSSINITDIAAKLFTGKRVPNGVPQIVFDELSITVTPSTKYLKFEAGSKTPWNLTTGFALNYFNLDFAYDGQKEKSPFSGEIKTQIQIGKELLISLQADLNAPNTNGWTFIADVETKDKNINLGQMAQDIVTTFHVENPLPVPEFVSAWILRKLHVEFNTDSKNFDFTLNLANSDAPGLELDFGLHLKNGDNTFSMEFDGTAIYNTPTPPVKNMEVDLKIKVETQEVAPKKTVTFLGTYKTDKSPPTLADLLAAISDHFHTNANLPGELKLDAEVDGFAVFIKKVDDDPILGELAGAFQITIDQTKLDVYLAYSNEVTSDAAYKNRIFVDDGKPAYVLGASLGGVIDLSSLPVVGKVPGLSDWAIDKLGFFYTNAKLPNKDDKAYFEVPQVSESKDIKKPLAPTPAQAVVSKTGFNLIAIFGKKGIDSQSPITPLGNMNIPVGTGTPPPKQSPSFATQPVKPDSPAHWIDINKTIGPVSLKKIGLNYSKGEATLGFSASFAVTAFVLEVDGLTITFPLPLGSQEKGDTVSFDLEGLSLDIKKGDLEIGGGFLKVVDDNVLNYFGTVIVKAGAFGFTAIGGYSPDQEVTPKTPPGAQPVKIPASFFIFANISIPLGGPPCFFVTGFAGGFGINRNLLLPTIEELPSYPLLPHNAKSLPVGGTPKEALTSVLPALAHIFKDEPGEYWIAVGVQFKTFEMIESFALVTVAFGVDFQIALLGQCAMTLPPEDDAAPLAYIEIDIIASLNPAIGQFALDGRLNPASFVFEGLCHISGGFAFYFWFGKSEHRGDFVVSIGGYHPAFDKDQYKHYPTVPRLSMSFGIGPLQMGGEAYFALTPSMLMAGLRVYATWESGPLKAWFDAGFDFLLGWAPFHYEADAFVHIGISLDLKLFVISLHIGVDLAIWGPDFGGLATIDLDIITFTIHFGSARATPPPVGWNTFQEKFLPADEKAKPSPMFHSASRFALDAEPLAPTSKISASVTKGLVPEKSGDSESPSTKEFSWVVEPNYFVIAVSSSIPSNEASFNAAKISNNTDDYGQDSSVPYLKKPSKVFSDQNKQIWNSDLSIGPMKKKGIHSYLTVTVTKEDKNANTNDSAFTLEPSLLDVPQSLWGEYQDSSTTNPNPPDNKQLVESALVGLLLSPIPRHPGVVSNILLEALIFQHDHQTVFFYSVPAVDSSFSVSTPPTNDATKLNIVINPQNPEPSLKSPIMNSNYILAALGDPWVSSKRNPIIDALHNEFATYSASEVNVSILAKDKALTDWPAVSLLGA